MYKNPNDDKANVIRKDVTEKLQVDFIFSFIAVIFLKKNKLFCCGNFYRQLPYHERYKLPLYKI